MSGLVVEDPVIRLMREGGIPVTRDEYIYPAYFGQPPEEWTAELEAELPEALQDWSRLVAPPRARRRR